MLQNTRAGKITYATDAWNMDTATWLKYINMARWPSELNVGVATCRGRKYYVTIRDIAPTQELLTHYGDSYDLDINHNAFWFWTQDGRRFNLGFMGVALHDEFGNVIMKNDL